MEILYFLFGWMLGKDSSKMESKSSITRIDDKNWIVDGKFVSLEEDTSLHRMQQREEDNKHYWNYEHQRLMYDRERIVRDLIKTKRAIREKPSLKDCVTADKLEQISEEYKQYEYMCDKLQELKLTKEEFLVNKEYPSWCVDFTNSFFLLRPVGVYNIYNTKTARYAEGNMTEKIKAEFKEKWY